jgi:hypothetical protein
VLEHFKHPRGARSILGQHKSFVCQQAKDMEEASGSITREQLLLYVKKQKERS